MQTTKTGALLFYFLISVLLYSCVPQQKVSSSKKEIGQVTAQLEQYNETLEQIDARRAKKQSDNEIDDSSNSRLQRFINQTQNEIGTLINNNKILVGQTIIDKEDWERLRNALTSTKNSTQKINDKILFLNDLISRNLVLKLDQDVVFEPGEYRVSPALAQTMLRQFEPAAREIDHFIKKYPEIPLSLVIMAKGYSDASVIPTGSQLHRDLKQRLNLSNTEPDHKALNKELSRARAESVKLLFQKFAASRPDNKIFQSKVLYLYEGKGEMTPDPSITNYRSRDPRRRVVLLYWSVFPE